MESNPRPLTLPNLTAKISWNYASDFNLMYKRSSSSIVTCSTSHRDTSMTYCQSITQTFIIIWVKSIPLSLRSKTRRRATPLLPTWIYSCRSRVTVSCALPFTTNVTISTSISQTFRSWVAIFHLRQPMVFFMSQLIRYARACSSYECFILRAARLSSKLLGQGYVMERLKSKIDYLPKFV